MRTVGRLQERAIAYSYVARSLPDKKFLMICSDKLMEDRIAYAIEKELGEIPPNVEFRIIKPNKGGTKC